MLQDSNDVVEYILKKYSKASKIVEIGIGSEESVFSTLKQMGGFELTAVDSSKSQKGILDNIFEPEISIYQGAELLYSIRPSPEMIPAIRKIGEKVGADVLIRPLSTDACHKPAQMKLVNHGKAVIWEEHR